MLLEEVALRGRTAPSRVLFGPHETNLARRREISDRHVAYYAERAEGGAGLIVTEVASVHDSDWPLRAGAASRRRRLPLLGYLRQHGYLEDEPG